MFLKLAKYAGLVCLILSAVGCNQSQKGTVEGVSSEDSARLFTSKYISPDSLYSWKKNILPNKSEYETTVDYLARSSKTMDSLYKSPIQIEVYAKHNYNPETEEFSLSVETDKVKIGSSQNSKEIVRIPMIYVSDWNSIQNNPDGKMNTVYGFASYDKPVWRSEDTIKIKCSKAEAQNVDKRLRLIFIIKLSPEFASVPIGSKSDSLNDYAARSVQLMQNGEYEVIENVTYGANLIGYYVVDSKNGAMKEKKLFSL